jgi:rhomboid family GlyGly-CTERM serine protease
MAAHAYRLLVIGFCVAGLALLQEFTVALEFNRSAILNGEIWRIWTAHFVHSNTNHLTVNALATIILMLILYKSLQLNSLLIEGLIFTTLLSLLMLAICPHIQWYNGLSGLLHAITANFFMKKSLQGDRLFQLATVVLCLKVLWESVRSLLGYEKTIGDASVVFEAHFIAVVLGTTTALIRQIYQHQLVKSVES